MAVKLKDMITRGSRPARKSAPAPAAAPPRKKKAKKHAKSAPRADRALTADGNTAPGAPAASAPSNEPRRRVGRPRNTESTALTKSLSQLTRRDSELISGIFSQIPRDEIAAVLGRTSISGDAKKTELFISLMSSADHANADWVPLCRAARVEPHDLLEAIIGAYQREGNLRVARLFPDMLEQLAKSGTRSSVEPCAICDGDGVIEVEGDTPDTTKKVKCGNCVMGRVYVPANLGAAKLALEAAGFVGKGPMIAQQFVGGAPAGRGGAQPVPDMNAPDMSDWSRETDAVFEERGGQYKQAVMQAEEGEVVDGTES